MALGCWATSAFRRGDVFGFSLGDLMAMTLVMREPVGHGRLEVASVDQWPDHAQFLAPGDRSSQASRVARVPNDARGRCPSSL
jgi:hypothetical protein